MLLYMITYQCVFLCTKYKFNNYTFLFLSFFLWYIGESINNVLCIKLSVLCFFTFTFISSIFIVRSYSDILFKWMPSRNASLTINEIKNDYILIKLLLLMLIAINFIIIIFVNIQILSLVILSIFKYYNIVLDNDFFKFSFFLGKNKFNINLKGVFGFGDNNPKNPKNPDINFFSDSNSNKRNQRKNINKDISKKALEMKEKLLKVQKASVENTQSLRLKASLNNICTQTKQQNMKREWNSSIIIEERQELTYLNQLDRIQEEYKAYDNQDRKFRSIINNIKKEREQFYPNEAQSLFKEYLDILKVLKKNLKSMESEMKKKSS
uniref:Uncharacterized protein n=1 Tax=Clonostachys rogersoniana TaxID=122658 RepID=A0A8F1Y2H3_CLORO|nr:hypothetical protein [Clonostachys rogersoniana]